MLRAGALAVPAPADGRGTHGPQRRQLRAAVLHKLRHLVDEYNALYTPQVRRIEAEARAYFERGDTAGMLRYLALKREEHGTTDGNQYGAWWRMRTAMLSTPDSALLRAYLSWLRRERGYIWSEPERLGLEENLVAFLQAEPWND